MGCRFAKRLRTLFVASSPALVVYFNTQEVSCTCTERKPRVWHHLLLLPLLLAFHPNLAATPSLIPSHLTAALPSCPPLTGNTPSSPPATKLSDLRSDSSVLTSSSTSSLLWSRNCIMAR